MMKENAIKSTFVTINFTVNPGLNPHKSKPREKVAKKNSLGETHSDAMRDTIRESFVITCQWQ